MIRPPAAPQSWLRSQAATLFPQSIVTLDGGKLLHLQKWDGQETTLLRELVDGKLILVRWTTWEPHAVGHYHCPFSPACCEKAKVFLQQRRQLGQWRLETGSGLWQSSSVSSSVLLLCLT